MDKEVRIYKQPQHYIFSCIVDGAVKHEVLKIGFSGNISEKTKSAEQETRLSEENLALFVEDIKRKLIKEDLFGCDINSALKKVSSSKALFDAVLPIYNRFCCKKN